MLEVRHGICVEVKYAWDSLFYFYSPLKIALFPHFSHRVLEVLPRLVWGQRSCIASLIFAVVGLSESIQEVGVIILGLSGSVGINGSCHG